MKSSDLQAHCDVLRKVRATSELGRHSYEPTLIAGTYSITREQKTALAFVGYVLGQIQGRSPASGTILSQEGKAHGVHLGDKYKAIKNIVETLRHWTAAPRPEQPPVILNRHCPYCPFRKECADQALKEDHLSLLDRMTPKLIKKYEQKGIFTVKQLSYLFRPRRSRKKTPCIRFKPELQALAIRTNKIYLQQPQSRARAAVEIFLDIEGMPDEGFNYLIGLLISNGQPLTYESFWADRKENEPKMWNAFLSAVGQHPDAPIYHYGRYETKAIESFTHQYGGDIEALKKRLINVNSWIFGRVYFPVRSDNLKELGKYLGARWTSPDASGLQSLVWRHRWEETADENLKRQLLTYNEEDCRALGCTPWFGQF